MTNIQVEHLTKRFGPLAAVDDLSFTVQEGRVTGFLGANGSGKTTTLRILLGLSEATAGTASIGGRRYAALRVKPERYSEGDCPIRSRNAHWKAESDE